MLYNLYRMDATKITNRHIHISALAERVCIFKTLSKVTFCLIFMVEHVYSTTPH